MEADASADAVLDCAIIGAGPAGLTAALYLLRFRRRIAVFDTGASRAQWIPRSHNLPGFPHGAHGPDFLDALRRQLCGYGGEIVAERVDEVGKPDGQFVLQTGDRALQARTVILATGVVEVLPPAPHLTEAIRSAVVRVCPICDGFEARGRRIAVLGRGDHAGREALFLRAYSADITLILAPEDRPSADLSAQLAAARVNVIHADPADLTLHDGGARLRTSDGGALTFEVVYAAYGVTAQTRPVRALSPATDAGGRLLVGEHQETSVDGLYAAGDIVRGLNQISVAEGEAAIAATAIHNRLPRNLA